MSSPCNVFPSGRGRWDVLTDSRHESWALASVASISHGLCIYEGSSITVPRKEPDVEKIVRSETSIEYFKELVERAMERQRVMSSELSCFYLVQLLENFVSFDQKCDGIFPVISFQV